MLQTQDSTYILQQIVKSSDCHLNIVDARICYVGQGIFYDNQINN